MIIVILVLVVVREVVNVYLGNVGLSGFNFNGSRTEVLLSWMVFRDVFL